jgi:hypothetical protein
MQDVIIDGSKVPGYDIHAHCEAVVHGPAEGGIHVRIAGSDSVVLTDEQFHAALVWPTAAQWDAIHEQVARYDDDDVPADGLEGYTIQRPEAWGFDENSHYPDGAAAVQFRYHYEDPERRDAPGLEVAVYDRDGKVIDAQDFG